MINRERSSRKRSTRALTRGRYGAQWYTYFTTGTVRATHTDGPHNSDTEHEHTPLTSRCCALPVYLSFLHRRFNASSLSCIVRGDLCPRSVVPCPRYRALVSLRVVASRNCPPGGHEGSRSAASPDFVPASDSHKYESSNDRTVKNDTREPTMGRPPALLCLPPTFYFPNVHSGGGARSGFCEPTWVPGDDSQMLKQDHLHRR